MSATMIKVKGIWHYRFQVAGRRVQRSTREASKGRAETVADRAYKDAVVRANGGEPVPTLRELGRAWLEIHRPVASNHHVKGVETLLRLHLYGLGDKKIGDITTEDVELARNEHLKTRKPATANHWLAYLKLLTMWAVNRGILDKAPWKVKMLKVQKKPRPTLPLDIAHAWFAAVDAASASRPAIGTAVRLMFGLGLRESEVITARWEWIDWQRGTYTPGKTKGKEADPVPMPPWLRERIEPLRQPEGMIVCQADGQPFASGFARDAMRKANAACKVKGITPHRLRGTFATLLSESGVPIQTIKAVMRHKSFLTTMGYLEKNLDLAVGAQINIAQKAGLDGAKVANDSA
jgi:integrase/recombinase XerC